MSTRIQSIQAVCIIRITYSSDFHRNEKEEVLYMGIDKDRALAEYCKICKQITADNPQYDHVEGKHSYDDGTFHCWLDLWNDDKDIDIDFSNTKCIVNYSDGSHSIDISNSRKRWLSQKEYETIINR